MLFHPTRRFLYTLDQANRLTAYTFDSSGQLQALVILEQAGGSLAITNKE